MHNGFNEFQAAKEIINAAENGYFSYMFRANQILNNADDFTTAENFRKWQNWYREEMLNTGVVGGEVIINFYTMYFDGLQLVLTASDALTDGPKWYHALDAISILPSLAKVKNFTFSVRSSTGAQIARVGYGAKGGLEIIEQGAEAATRNISEVFSRAISLDTTKTLVKQGDNTRCGNSVAAMLLRDFGVNASIWADDVLDGVGGLDAPQLRDLFNASTPAGHSLRNATVHTEIGWRQLVDYSKVKPVAAIIESPTGNGPYHWVIVDGVEWINRNEHVKIRDPWTGKAWAIPIADFSLKFSGGALSW